MNREDKRGIFFGVVGVLTLIVAIIGASLAWFSINANSKEDALTVQAASVQIVYADGNGISVDNLIPSTKTVALTTLKRYLKGNKDEDETPYRECIDDKGNVVCAVYEFSLTNNGTNPVDITARIKPKAIPNDDEGQPTYPAFQNLKYTLYDISEAEMLENGYSQEEGQAKAVEVSETNIDGTITYNEFNILPTATELGSGADNVKRYRLFIWLDEKGDENNKEQGAEFYGQVFIDVAGEGNENITGEANADSAK